MASRPVARFRALLWTAVVFLVVFVCLQFIRPELTNPPVTAELQAPPEVKQVLKSSCYNCHSNETKLPWFDKVVPAYWVVSSDVNEARKHLNFSEIGKLPAAQQKAFLFEAVNMIQLGAMPLPAYLRVHPGAKVTPEELAILRNYLTAPPPDQNAAKTAEAAKAASAGNAADVEYGKWIHESQPENASAMEVKPEFNGVAYIPAYKNWKVISSTDRFDNHTLREILGNDVAVKAIAENHINPWPDGTMFAKVAWAQSQPDENGVVKTGAFVQVELMIKDAKKYASTEGWGFGRWRGTDLKPYGKDTNFQNECTTCHAPMARNDYAYTMPIGGQQ
jgi:hypothetical protein